MSYHNTTKKITNFIIDSSDLVAGISTRKLIISGDSGAKCVLFISNEDLNYYDIATEAFISAETNINIELPTSGTYELMVSFPLVTDDDQYDFQLIANKHHNTELSPAISTSPIYYKKSIIQKENRVLTTAVATTTTGDFQTMPTSVTVTKPASSVVKEVSKISWTIKAVDAIAGGALTLTRQPLLSDFKFSIVHESIGLGTAATASTNPTILYLDSVDNLAIGMAVTTIESSTVAGSPVITKIDNFQKMVTLSVAQTWVTAKDITFEGSCGTPQLSSATGANVTITDISAELTPFTATVTPAVTSTNDIACVAVFGIKVGATYTGIGVDNETPQVVTGVTYGDNSFSTTSNQTLQNKTILTFSGSSQEAVIKARLIVNKMPKENLTLTLDLDSILTSNVT